MKVTDLKSSPKSFQELRGKLVEATEDELVICRFTSAAVFISKNADESVVQADYCKKNKIPVIRTDAAHKSSGYHDSNEFRVLAVVTKESDYPFLKSQWSRGRVTQMQALRAFRGIMTSALSEFDVKARCMGDNILVKVEPGRLEESEKKIGRLSARVLPNIVRFSGHILLDWDIDAAEKAIISPKHNMREHVRGLKELGYDITFDKMREAFVAAWEKVFGN